MMRSAGPQRQPGAPHAATILVVDLLPDTNAFCDIGGYTPRLVIDTGPTELQLLVPGERITLADLTIVDRVFEAVASYRTVLIAYLD